MEHTRDIVMLTAVFLCWIAFANVEGTLTNCKVSPKYVTPNDTTVCTCTYTGANKNGWKLLWVDPDGHMVASTPERYSRGTENLGLTTAYVTRDTEGRNFSCILVSNTDYTPLDTYTPVFAYGPENMAITGTKTSSHDDNTKRVTTLTCSATVKPTAAFQWQGYPKGAVIAPGCSCQDNTYSSTLTFDSDLYQGGEVITCTVTNTVPDWPSSKQSEVTLPTESPTVQNTESSVNVPVIATLGALLGLAIVVAGILGLRLRRALCPDDERTPFNVN